MKLSFRGCGEKAITLLEVLVVIVVIVVLAGIFLPSLTAAKPGAQRIKCASNLKQVGLAFRIFAVDNNDKYPFEATNSIAFQRTSNAWVHYQAMSNELASAKILMCPADRNRLNTAATDFLNAPISLSWSNHQDMSISYFVGLGARETKAQSILTGDRSMARSVTTGLYSNSRYGGANQVTANSTWLELLHGCQGNIVLGDASVKQVTEAQLRDQLQAAVNLYGVTNNYFLFPQ